MAFTSSFYGGGDIYADWKTISVAAAALSILGSAALIMLSRLFSLKNLEQVAKTEFVFAASTVMIVLMTVAIVSVAEARLGGTNSLARCLYLNSLGCACNDPSVPAGAFSNTDTLIDWMKLYMATPTHCVQKFMDILYAMEIPIGAMSSVYMEIFMSEHAGGFGVKWIEERIMNATQSFSFYMYMFYLLDHALDFIKYYAGFFFSIGVVLRAFPPSRGVGAYLMALSFGLYFVFPLSYILIATFSLPHAQSDVVADMSDPGRTCGTVGGPDYACALPQVPDTDQFACGSSDPGRFMDFRTWLIANYDGATTFIRVRLPDFERNLAHSICIFPMMAFVVLLTFVLNTTNLFGGNIPEIGRGLVKLI